MDIIHNLILASETIFSFEYLYYVFLGTIVGIIIGALPGIGPTLGIAISLPLTYTLSAVNAMIFLVSIYCGAMYGGAISAILFNTPGTGSATATTMEGYPMAQKGEAILALSLSALCSSFGGIIAAILVIFITPLLVEFMLIFWTPEYLMLSIFGIASYIGFYKGKHYKRFNLCIFWIIINYYWNCSDNCRYTLHFYEARNI